MTQVGQYAHRPSHDIVQRSNKATEADIKMGLRAQDSNLGYAGYTIRYALVSDRVMHDSWRPANFHCSFKRLDTFALRHRTTVKRPRRCSESTWRIGSFQIRRHQLVSTVLRAWHPIFPSVWIHETYYLHGQPEELDGTQDVFWVKESCRRQSKLCATRS